MYSIIIGIIFIIGGLSGYLELIGTGSGVLLAAVGVLLIISGASQNKNPTDEKQVDKNIRQMRYLFAFVGVVNIISTILLIPTMDSEFLIGKFLIVILVASTIVLCIAFFGLGKRTKIGYIFAIITSVYFILCFPVLTYFGISYLGKLSKPEMKAEFSK